VADYGACCGATFFGLFPSTPDDLFRSHPSIDGARMLGCLDGDASEAHPTCRAVSTSGSAWRVSQTICARRAGGTGMVCPPVEGRVGSTTPSSASGGCIAHNSGSANLVRVKAQHGEDEWHPGPGFSPQQRHSAVFICDARAASQTALGMGASRLSRAESVCE
jgi:hypothetical protein